jgi:hypothetical protein
MGQGFEKTSDGIEVTIRAIVTRGHTMSSYLNRYLYPKYQQAQIERWQTANQSQREEWRALTPQYKKRKIKKFASYPGGGQVLMVATSRLSMAAQGRDGALKIVTDRTMTVGVDLGVLPYAKYPGAVRPFMTFSDETIQDWVDGVARYVMTGAVT